MRALGPIDLLFLTLESRKQPMHVGGLFLFKLPEHAPSDFVWQFVQSIRASTEKPVQPFNQVLNGYFWDKDDDFDIDQHFRHIALPQPGRIRELLTYVSQEHSALLDRAKPLWECHVIEGIEDNRFAMYFKIHHALTDGVGGMKLIQRALSPFPVTEDIVPPWAVKDTRHKKVGITLSKTTQFLNTIAKQIQIAPNVTREVYTAITQRSDPNYVSVFQAPRSILNQPVSASRRFAAQSYDLQRLRDIAKKLTKFLGESVTINDIILAICSGAMRAYLSNQNALPAKPLIAMVPVSIRQENDDSGNAIAIILANLATHLNDPLERLNVIRASINNAKQRMKRMTSGELLNYTGIVFSMAGLNLVTGAAPKLQSFNIVISNVPGPKETLYWNGAMLDALYPVSIVMDGQATNITLTSYRDKLEVGIIACRKTLPSIQSLLGLLEYEIVILERLTSDISLDE
ncbi:WS/DGAT/MGAT family O-acyltransferase [Aquirhabdus parva]|uniref:diacylglycerol O-acyltransferase n=1 Tax=Aquirhabdus parva TaxID=2283318 RepID=A0A345P723_9GAMM|nr:wax ester/triacylglycerol synthase family O-acyltransferase [Aquirhabdus parva]AXI03082.1 wax ester/triacylglycerol synthase family O-acyltransferase [Aquirhabdus parva]